MKKLAIIFSLFALLVGCEQVSDLDQIGQNNDVENGGAQGGVLPKTLSASVESNETRAFVGDDNVSVLWHSGDAVSYFGERANAKYVYNGEDGAPEATMEFVSAGTENYVESDYTYAVYPYAANMTIDIERPLYLFEVTYPTTQTYAEGSFGKGANVMVAAKEKSSEGGYTFRHAGGYFVLKLYGEGVSVKTITLSALDSSVKLAGDAYLAVENDSVYEVVMKKGASSEITLDCSNGGSGVALGATAETATEFWFALPVVNIEGGLKILVTATDNRAFEKQTTKPVNIGRGKVQPMAALKFECNVTTPYQIFYTTSDGQRIDFSHLEEETWGPFNAAMARHTYSDGKGVITFSEPLTHINQEAFHEKSTLTSITFPKSLVHIGKDAFDCTALTEVTFPESLETIDSSAFSETPISSITFAEGLKTIGNYAFFATDITSITLPDSLETIGINAFYNTNITSLTIPGSVTSIGYKAFQSSDELTTVEFKPSPTESPLTFYFLDRTTKENAPFYQSPLTTVILNRELVAKVGDVLYEPDYSNGIFVVKEQIRQLTSVTLGEQVKTIMKSMFCGAQFTSLTIPGNVTKIGVDAFSDCENLTKLTFESGTEDLQISYINDDFLGEWGPFHDSPLKTLVLHRNLVPTYTVDEDNDGLFAEIATLNSVTLGPNVKTIGNYMFFGTGITSITIPSSVTTIGVGAFSDTPITSLTIPGSVTKIGVDAFYNCESLSTVTFEPSDTETPLKIGQGISSLGLDLGPFYYSPLSTINLNRELQYIDENGNNFVADYWDEGVFTNYKHKDTSFTTSIEIGWQVKTILPYMFSHTRVRSIWIPNNVTSIGKRAFYNCLAFQGLSCNHTTPPTLADDAFEDCDAMWYIVVPTESMSAFKNADNWEDYDRNNSNGVNFYYPLP